MATTNGVSETDSTERRSDNRRNQVMLGDLPNDFLRTDGAPRTQLQEDERIAVILQAQQQAGVNMSSNIVGRLSISVVQAKLNKNYGLTKMDPYCRIGIGHTVFETPTAYNGAKNPSWNKTVTTYLPVGVDSLYVEIFDERSFTMDDRIAWSHIKIPECVLKGDTSDEWHLLTGRLGEDKEGCIKLVLSLSAATAENNMYSFPGTVPVMMPTYYPVAVPGAVVQQIPHHMQQQQQQPQGPVGPMYTNEDLKQVKDMFPNMEEEVVKSVLEANNGNKDATINSLLSMSAE